ncbi:uncharacterized protein ACIBXB_007503 isoform 3-T3 [Morphnus guianensis]
MQITLKTLQQQTFRIDIDPEETGVVKCSMSYLGPVKARREASAALLCRLPCREHQTNVEKQREGLVTAVSVPSWSVV